MDKLQKKESKNVEKTKSKNTKKPKLNNVEKIKPKKRTKIKVIFTSIIIIIIVYIINLVFFGTDKSPIVIDEYAKFRSSKCPEGQIMSSWENHENGELVVRNCEYPRSCSNGKKLTANCGALFDDNGYFSSCSTTCLGNNDIHGDLKPVIYLYPQNKMDIRVKLDYKGKLIADYPDYNYDIKGWELNAEPDSTIINMADNKKYSYLFWEGIPKEPINRDINKGFVVKGSESKEFLQEILPKIGLTPKEYNEFIVYWYPIMQANSYNLVHFSGKQYTDNAPLETTPQYDSLLRVFMVVKPLDKPIDIQPQIFNGFERKGFSVVEWGGTILK